MKPVHKRNYSRLFPDWQEEFIIFYYTHGLNIFKKSEISTRAAEKNKTQ